MFAGKIGPDPRNFNQRVSLGRNDLLIRTFLRFFTNLGKIRTSCNSTQINLKYRFINSNFTDPGEALNYYNKKKRPASMLAFLVRQVGTQKSIVLSLTYLAKVASRLFALALDFMLMEAV